MIPPPLLEAMASAMAGEREEYWRDPYETRTKLPDSDLIEAALAAAARAGFVLVDRGLIHEASVHAESGWCNDTLAARLRQAAEHPDNNS